MTGPAGTGQALSPDEEQAIVETIHGVIRDYAAAWSTLRCANQDGVLKFFDWSGPGLVDANETTVTEYPGDAFPTLLKEAACSREREDVGIGTLVVRVFSRDLVSVSWTFHATYFFSDAPPKKVRGAALQIFRRTPDGWKTPVGMSTHQPASTE